MQRLFPLLLRLSQLQAEALDRLALQGAIEALADSGLAPAPALEASSGAAA